MSGSKRRSLFGGGVVVEVSLSRGEISIYKDSELSEEGVVWAPARIAWPSWGSTPTEETRAFVAVLEEAIAEAEALDREFPVGSPFTRQPDGQADTT